MSTKHKRQRHTATNAESETDTDTDDPEYHEEHSATEPDDTILDRTECWLYNLHTKKPVGRFKFNKKVTNETAIEMLGQLLKSAYNHSNLSLRWPMPEGNPGVSNLDRCARVAEHPPGVCAKAAGALFHGLVANKLGHNNRVDDITAGITKLNITDAKLELAADVVRRIAVSFSLSHNRKQTVIRPEAKIKSDNKAYYADAIVALKENEKQIGLRKHVGGYDQPVIVIEYKTTRGKLETKDVYGNVHHSKNQIPVPDVLEGDHAYYNPNPPSDLESGRPVYSLEYVYNTLQAYARGEWVMASTTAGFPNYRVTKKTKTKPSSSEAVKTWQEELKQATTAETVSQRQIKAWLLELYHEYGSLSGKPFVLRLLQRGDQCRIIPAAFFEEKGNVLIELAKHFELHNRPLRSVPVQQLVKRVSSYRAGDANARKAKVTVDDKRARKASAGYWYFQTKDHQYYDMTQPTTYWVERSRGTLQGQAGYVKSLIIQGQKQIQQYDHTGRSYVLVYLFPLDWVVIATWDPTDPADGTNLPSWLRGV